MGDVDVAVGAEGADEEVRGLRDVAVLSLLRLLSRVDPRLQTTIEEDHLFCKFDDQHDERRFGRKMRDDGFREEQLDCTGCYGYFIISEKRTTHGSKEIFVLLS